MSSEQHASAKASFEHVLAELIDMRQSTEENNDDNNNDDGHKAGFDLVLRELLAQRETNVRHEEQEKHRIELSNMRNELQKQKEENSVLRAKEEVRLEMKREMEAERQKLLQQIQRQQDRHELAAKEAAKEAATRFDDLVRNMLQQQQQQQQQQQHQQQQQQTPPMKTTPVLHGLPASTLKGPPATEEEWIPPMLRGSPSESPPDLRETTEEDKQRKALKLSIMEAELEELQIEELQLDSDPSQILASLSSLAATAAERMQQKTSPTLLSHGSPIVQRMNRRTGEFIPKTVKERWVRLADEFYQGWSNSLYLNQAKALKFVGETHEQEFAPILDLCPDLDVILAHMLVIRFGLRVQEVSWTSEMSDWTREDCRRVGRSMAPILRMVQTGDAGVDAWRSNYPQLNRLFEIEGFEEVSFQGGAKLFFLLFPPFR